VFFCCANAGAKTKVQTRNSRDNARRMVTRS
jgi:hypothetical protein